MSDLIEAREQAEYHALMRAYTGLQHAASRALEFYYGAMGAVTVTAAGFLVGQSTASMFVVCCVAMLVIRVTLDELTRRAIVVQRKLNGYRK